MTTSNSRWDEHKLASALFNEGKYEEALRRYRALAEAGSETAQVFLGWMYHAGHGVRQDFDEAHRWYQKAADNNSPVAQFYLGTLYRTQHLYQQAMEWFERSASQGYMSAIFLLGVMYDSGEGVAVDKQKAYGYYERAAKMGHLFAQRKIVARMMKGQLGIMGILQALAMLGKIIWTGIRIGWKDPESDRIRW